jgi:hypothetical protein
MHAYNVENDRQIAELAKQLKGENEISSCYNIFGFLINEVNYRADGADQLIKSPARLIYERRGDCKSYSVFTACCLKYLGIKHFFRFAGYGSDTEPTHVYIIAVIDNKEIPIDAVAYVQLGQKFGTEKKYKLKIDMAGKIAYLSGLRGVDEIDLNDERFKIWLDEDDGVFTQAKGFLLSEYDLAFTETKYASDNDSQLRCASRAVATSIMIMVYDKLYFDSNSLYKAGVAIDFLMKNNLFNVYQIDDISEMLFSDKLFDKVLSYAADFQNLETSSSFQEWWKINVLELNKPYFDEYGNEAAIGAVQETRNSLKKSGGYFIYSLANATNNSKVTAKKKIQDYQRTWQKNQITSIGSTEQDNLYRSGCTELFTATPEDSIAAFKQGINGTSRVGFVVTAAFVAAIIAAVVTIIGIVANLIIAFKTNKGQLSNAELNAGAFSDSDWNFANADGTGTGTGTGTGISSSLFLPIGLMGAALLLLFTKKKKETTK